MTLGIVLLQGHRRGVFLMSEVPLLRMRPMFDARVVIRSPVAESQTCLGFFIMHRQSPLGSVDPSF